MSASFPASPIRYLIFDFDGTLADSVARNAVRFGRLLEQRFGLPIEQGRRHFITTAGREIAPRFEEALRGLVGITDVHTSDLVEAFFQDVIDGPMDVFPEVAPCFGTLRASGWT